ncbi:O-antigen ligase family protein [Enterobacter sp. ECC-175]|uniref:O-antigen ligase family protein n=1 Tax=unclassified Enterobacter TaxID=2608935 RepID=UPI0015EB7934|nr:O-antigen ligase family protein [Enterobacter sp. RIT 418]
MIILFYLFFACQFSYVYSGLIAFQFLNMLLGAFSIFYIYPYLSRNGWFFIILLAVFSTLTTLLSLKFKFGDIAFAVTMPLFAGLISLHRHELKWPALAFCTFSVCYCGYAIIMGWDLNTALFLSSSRNYISVLGIFSFYCVVISTASNKLKVMFLVLVSLIILFSNSRSAFISFSLVLMFYICCNANKYRKTSFVLVSGVLIILPIVILNYTTEIYDYLYNSLGVVRRLSAGELSDTGRFDVIKCYYDKFDSFSLLLGLDYFASNTCSFLANGTDNPHNSFIRLYSNLGLFSLIIFYFLLWALIRLFCMREYLLFSFLLCFIARGGTDILFFFQSWDAYLYSLIFLSLPVFFFNAKGQEKSKIFNI